MKRAFYWTVLLHLMVFQTAVGQCTPLTFGHIDTLYSAVLGESRALWVYVPAAGPDDRYYAPKRYPVLYLLDAEANYFYTSSLVQQLSLGAEVGQAECPAMIVVGIINTNRSRDLTPTHSTKGLGSFVDRSLQYSGGGEAFINFVERELLPYVDAHYPTLPYRSLLGHSFGGLMVLHTLATRPHLFNAYVALEPSLWWDRTSLLQRLTTKGLPPAAQGKKLFVAVANTLPLGQDTLALPHDITRSTLQLRANLALRTWLRRQPKGSLAWTWRYYPQENHFSVGLPAPIDALRAVFHHAPIQLPPSATDLAYTAEAMQQQYAAMSQQLGYRVVPPEELINQMGWSCLQQQLWTKAAAFFQLNARAYPQSYNANSSLGEYYKRRSDQKQALHYYTQALRILDVPETRQAIQELQAQRVP